MHPPFYIPDTRVSYDVSHHHDSKPVIRRGMQPQVLRFLPLPGWPPIHPLLKDRIDPDVIAVPSGKAVPDRTVLRVVPEPRNGLRDTFGRFLIRVGQRILLENRPG